MPKVRIDAFAVSLDGYGAGPDQSLDNPLGRGGEGLHQWFFPTRTFQRMVAGKEDGTTGVDDRIAAASLTGVGAWIMGRHMFTPSRGPWPDDGWRGWWGEEPVYHCPVFVLTHHPRPPLEMTGTTFHFVTDGIEDALFRAKEVAGDRDVRIGGGVETVREFLQARLVDEMHLAMSPVVLGAGEALFAGLDLKALCYEIARREMTEAAMHVFFKRK